LFLGKEFIEKFKARKEQPVLIINLDGALGHWDYVKEMYVIRSKAVESLTILSQDFILVAISQ
jgi:hypothetical protein